MFRGSTKVSDAPEYSLDIALAGARDEAGLPDFGDDGFIEPLAKLIECVGEEVRFSPTGSLSYRGTIQRLLVNRLRYVRDVKAHPEILDEDVSDPIIILGMPRTGTTKLHRLYSADPQMQELALWRLLNPAPMTSEEPSESHERFAYAKIIEEATRANPEFTVSHETAADEADEDSYLLLPSFDYDMLYFVYPSKTYLHWVRQRSALPAYDYQKRMLQYLQWQDGGRKGRRWVLKNPGHVGYLKELYHLYPKATFVHSHRDMTEVLPSFCRLMEAMYNVLLESVDPIQLGRDMIDYYEPQLAIYRQQRAELEGKIAILDMPFIDIVKDPFPTIRRSYELAGVDYTAESEAAIRGWNDANQQHKFGKPQYSLERYGLDVAEIQARLGEG